MGDLASDVVPLLDALDIERAVLVGHSGSGLVARRVALDHPDRIAGLVLEASPLTLSQDDRFSEFVGTVDDLTDPIAADFARSFSTDTSTAGLDPALIHRLVDDVIKVPVRVWKELFGSLRTYSDVDQLADVPVPARLIWGDTDQLVTESAQMQLMYALPSAELIVYPGVGHTPRWEQPDRFAADLEAFATRCLG